MKSNILFCFAAAIAASRPRCESGPMNASGTASIFSVPSWTYCVTRSGKTVSSNWSQNGHWRSMYSIIVAGAFALPRTLPFCGTPASSLCTCADCGSVSLFVSEPVTGTFFSEEPPPASATPRPMPSAASTTTAPTAIRTLRLARRSGRAPGRAFGAWTRRWLLRLVMEPS